MPPRASDPDYVQQREREMAWDILGSVPPDPSGPSFRSTVLLGAAAGAGWAAGGRWPSVPLFLAWPRGGPPFLFSILGRNSYQLKDGG